MEGGRIWWEVVERTLRLLQGDWSELSCRSWGNFLWSRGDKLGKARNRRSKGLRLGLGRDSRAWSIDEWGPRFNVLGEHKPLQG